VLDTDFGIDEHKDFDLTGLPGVSYLGSRLEPRTNLGVQMALIARSRGFVGTCGGLAWMAPMLGAPTVALYDTDRMLGPHLTSMRHARHESAAAPFSTLDLTALARVGMGGVASSLGVTR
jgi:ADP-heptose:LPS heptosyltransferase